MSIANSINSYLKSNEGIAILISEKGVDMGFYIFNITCAILSFCIYISFRIGITSYLRVNKKSKTFIRKNKK